MCLEGSLCLSVINILFSAKIILAKRTFLLMLVTLLLIVLLKCIWHSLKYKFMENFLTSFVSSEKNIFLLCIIFQSMKTCVLSKKTTFQ